MSDSYLTLAGPGESAFEVRKSEFLGHARPAGSVAEAEAFVERVRGEYEDATHNVPAYRVRVEQRGPGWGRETASGDSREHGGPGEVPDESGGPGADYMLREYSSDDGEPTNSAGKPMLNVLQGQELENVVVVVTRYYGGTNLGVGGLVSAYGRAVKEAVEAAGVVEERPQESFAVTVDYDDSGTVRGILESADCEFDAEYGESVRFAVTVAREDAAALRDRLRDATSGRADIT